MEVKEKLKHMSQENAKVKVTLTYDGKGMFGEGRFSPAMRELYRDAQRLLGFTQEGAFIAARALGVDAGELNKGSVTLKYGASISKKTGTMTLKEVTESMKLAATPSLMIGSVCAQLDKARAIGLVVNDCTMDSTIMAWIAKGVATLEVTKES